MSDYGDDDYSDYGDDWFYVEDEYMAADDLAEHAVASPPPTAYGDEDAQPDWDRFDYFNDIEYASDGYDDATFQAHNAKDSKIGQKRKREVHKGRSKKRRRTTGKEGNGKVPGVVAHTPIIWRSQNDREPQPKLLDDDAPSYALLKDWREKLAETPRWAHGSPTMKSPHAQTEGEENNPQLLHDTFVADAEELEEDDEEGGVGISQDALMAALQRQLAAAGGPLSGMDPQQLLEFAMRMATDQDAGDDIAGEMADAMLDGEEEEDDAVAEENLMSWVAQQRNANKDTSSTQPTSPETTRNSHRPPTPPSSEAKHSVVAKGQLGDTKSKTWTATESQHVPSLKRKATAEEDEAEGSSQTTKKRATRSFDAPTAASKAKAAPAHTARAMRAKR